VFEISYFLINPLINTFWDSIILTESNPKLIFLADELVGNLNPKISLEIMALFKIVSKIKMQHIVDM